MKKVTMYTGNPCSFCAAAKALLKTKNVEIEEIDIWADPATLKKCYKEPMAQELFHKFLLGIITLVVMINFRKRTETVN